MKAILLSTTHWLMEADEARRVIWLRRQPAPFTSVEEIHAANAAVARCFEPRYAQLGLIVDMRQAPSRNDPAFEKAMNGLREKVSAHFARTAVLLATRVGVLQVNRISREDGAPSFATTDEASAIRFAHGRSGSD